MFHLVLRTIGTVRPLLQRSKGESGTLWHAGAPAAAAAAPPGARTTAIAAEVSST